MWFFTGIFVLLHQQRKPVGIRGLPRHASSPHAILPAMKPSTALDAHRSTVRSLARRFNTTNPRVFGSVAQGADQEGSDLDLLVDALPQATLLDLGGLQMALQDLLGVPVDVQTPQDLPGTFRDQVLRQARPV